jgi:hypothetical protein
VGASQHLLHVSIVSGTLTSSPSCSFIESSKALTTCIDVKGDRNDQKKG